MTKDFSSKKLLPKMRPNLTMLARRGTFNPSVVDRFTVPARPKRQPLKLKDKIESSLSSNQKKYDTAPIDDRNKTTQFVTIDPACYYPNIDQMTIKDEEEEKPIQFSRN